MRIASDTQNGAAMVRVENAKELALIAQEIGAEVIRGQVRYPCVA